MRADKTMAQSIDEHLIALAYAAMYETPNQETYRQGKLKKTNNPVYTAPIFNQVLTHLDVKHKLDWAKDRTREIVGEKAAKEILEQITSTEDLRIFLATLSFFLKTTRTRDRDPMQTFEDKTKQDKANKETPVKKLSPNQIIKEAYGLSRQFTWQSSEHNLNKFTKLAERIRLTRGKWECLAVLAQYYPLRGINQSLINHLVKMLEQLDITSFRMLVTQLLVFYSAADVTRSKPDE